MEKLTRSQIEELKAQLKEPQPTYGRHRAKVQNRLVAAGLSVMRDGRLYNPDDSWDVCCITYLGREFLAAQSWRGTLRGSSSYTSARPSDVVVSESKSEMQDRVAYCLSFLREHKFVTTSEGSKIERRIAAWKKHHLALRRSSEGGTSS